MQTGLQPCGHAYPTFPGTFEHFGLTGRNEERQKPENPDRRGQEKSRDLLSSKVPVLTSTENKSCFLCIND